MILYCLIYQPRNYEYGYRPNVNIKYKRNDNRQNTGKHFQSLFMGPISKPFPKNNQKYMNNQSGSSSYDGTPAKDTSGKVYQQGHGMPIKRESSNPDSDIISSSNVFGSNVPPFLFTNDLTELNQHYGPLGNGILLFIKNINIKYCKLVYSLFYHFFFYFCAAYVSRMTTSVVRPAFVLGTYDYQQQQQQ